MSAYPHLFSPIVLGETTLRNRVAHASILTRFVRDGQPTERFINYHASRARGGAGMIVTEPLAMVSTNTDPGRLRAYDDKGADALARVAEAVESQDCRLLGQVQDPGRGRHEVGRNDAAIGVSSLPDDLSWTVPHVVDRDDLQRLIAEWAGACARLQRAGWSGVELSTGHGHLFHQFLSPHANRREDGYGGDVDGRTRFLRELIDAIRARCGSQFIVGAKLPGDDGVSGSIDLDEAGRIAARLAGHGGIDYWTFVWGAHANSLWRHLPNAYGERAPYLPAIRGLRAAAPGVATGAIGYLTDPNEAEHAITSGTADFVFLGRPLITDPAWPNKSRTGRESEIRYCVSCNTCWRSIIDGHRLECDNNPRVAASEEADWQPAPARRRRRVVVVGAGIAGLEAAWVCAARGHEVIQIGAGHDVGGKTRLHAELPGGENLSSIYDFQWLAAKRHGVQFVLGETATVESVAALEPDVVLLATGADMRPPDFLPDEYVEAGFVPDLRALMQTLIGRNARESGRVVVLDRDHTEMTYAAAERLSQLFENVTIVTPRERIAADCSLVTRQQIYQRLHERRIELVTSHDLVGLDGIEDGKLAAHNVYHSEPVELADVVSLTYATARVPRDELRPPLMDKGFDVRTIGDCHAPRSVLAATRQGYQVAMGID